MSQRLVFIVEGQTEVNFVNKVIIPELIIEFPTCQPIAQTIISNRRKHKKGGVPGYPKFRNEIDRTLAQGDVLITTLIDFYKLPSDFPEFTVDSSRIDVIESAILEDFENNPNLIPYIQKHEFEALLFTNRTGFEICTQDKTALQEIDQIIIDYPNPEDINTGPESFPSKRMKAIFNYKKTFHGDLLLEGLTVDKIRHKCSRFSTWISKLKQRLLIF